MLAIVNSNEYSRYLDAARVRIGRRRGRQIHREGFPFDHVVEEAALLWYRSVWHGIGTVSRAGGENVSM